MKRYWFFKAQPIGGEKIETVGITFSSEFPECDTTEEYRDLIKCQGERLADALLSVLPQGVVDSLLVRLLDHTRTLLVVKHPKTSEFLAEKPK